MQVFNNAEPVGGFYELAQRCCLQGLVLTGEINIFNSELVGTVILPSQSEVSLFSLSKDEK